MGYYRTIDGKKMDAYLLTMADKAVQGAGDGRISKKDAEAIIKLVVDGGTYTEVEKNTMEYIRDNYKWTEGANEWLRSQIASWAAAK
ncbi:MAG: hypothetical protein MUF68_00910 [Cyclobacteriaceae bacterium]|nr:hypothetical protein [Cyclobacteriaceae bacterium]